MESPNLTLAALRDFLEGQVSRGELPKSSAISVRSHLKRVTDVLSTEEQSDVSRIDIDDAIRRFGNLNPKISQQSLRAYAARLRGLLDAFLTRQGLTPPARGGEVTARQVQGREARKHAARTRGTPRSTTTGRSPAPDPNVLAPAGLPYKFPLRPDLTVEIANVPRDLNLVEANRLAAFLRTLAEDFKP